MQAELPGRAVVSLDKRAGQSAKDRFAADIDNPVARPHDRPQMLQRNIVDRAPGGIKHALLCNCSKVALALVAAISGAAACLRTAGAGEARMNERDELAQIKRFGEVVLRCNAVLLGPFRIATHQNGGDAEVLGGFRQMKPGFAGYTDIGDDQIDRLPHHHVARH
jgi:hypothetical protein